MPKLNILIVEDDAIIGADLASTLISMGYSVLGPITRGEEVLEKIPTLAPELILMDIGLQGKLDGIQTAEMLQQIKALPIVFLTGLTDDEHFQRAKLLNPYGYLIKPFEAAELRSTIELTLHRFASRNEKNETDPPMFGDAPTSADSLGGVSEGDGLGGSANVANYFAQLSLFKGVKFEEIEALAKVCNVRKFESGEFISFEEDDTQGGFVTLSGRVSITKAADSGKELIVASLAPGDVLGLQFSMPAFAMELSTRTMSPSRVVWIPAAKWEYFKERHPIINKNLNLALTSELIKAYGLASALAHASVEGRIIRALFSLLPQFGKTTPDATNAGRIYITRRELAELTGTTPETAYRVTKNLEREKLLDLSRPGVLKIIDIAGLREAAVRH